jgi:membrane protein
VKDRLKQVPVLGTAIRMQERYVADAADALAASIGFFGFLSLFPLLALALAVVGVVVGDDPAAQQRVVDLITESVPGLGAIIGGDNEISAAVEAISSNTGTLVGFGSIGLVLAALRIASGAQQATAVVFRRDLPTGLTKRVQQVRALLVVGVFALAGAAVSGSVGVEIGSGIGELARSVVGTAIAVAIDFALFMLAYRLFTPGAGPPWRILVPGSLLAATGWVALKLFGTSYVTRQAANAESTYGALGSIIALLLLLYLAGRLFLYGAELAALLGHVDDVPSRDELAEDAVRVPRVSPRPVHDVAPEPLDTAKLAVSAGLLGATAAALGRVLRD